jgi:CheY-like chemotaxis protein
MDHMMPEMDGIEATRIIREEIGTEYAKNVPIFALTANAIMGSEEMFLSKGFQSFISKPIDISRLDSIIIQWVRDEEQEKLYKGRPVPGNEKSFYAPEGFDMHKGLERFSGDRDTFFQVLRSFVKNTRDLLESMKIINAGNLAVYAVNVHGIKSSCRGVCAEDIGNRAEVLENAAKAGDLDFVTANNPQFIEDVLKLIANIEDILAKGGIDTAASGAACSG